MHNFLNHESFYFDMKVVGSNFAINKQSKIT